MFQRSSRTKFISHKSFNSAALFLQMRNTFISDLSQKNESSAQITKSKMSLNVLTYSQKRGQRTSISSSNDCLDAPIPLGKKNDPLQVALQEIAALKARLEGNFTTNKESKSRPYSAFTPSQKAAETQSSI